MSRKRAAGVQVGRAAKELAEEAAGRVLLNNETRARVSNKQRNDETNTKRETKHRNNAPPPAAGDGDVERLLQLDLQTEQEQVEGADEQREHWAQMWRWWRGPRPLALRIAAELQLSSSTGFRFATGPKFASNSKDC